MKCPETYVFNEQHPPIPVKIFSDRSTQRQKFMYYSVTILQKISMPFTWEGSLSAFFSFILISVQLSFFLILSIINQFLFFQL